MQFNLVKIMGDIYGESDEIRQLLYSFKTCALPKFKKHEHYKELKEFISNIQKQNDKLNKNISKIITHRFIPEED